MPKARKGLSKRTRFEVFKRDRFMCVYCGATPVDRPLHVDHVEPVSAGGSETDTSNMVTACADCNLGKAAVPLSEKRLTRPMVSDADRDHSEQILEYLQIQRGRDEALRQLRYFHGILRNWRGER